MNVTVLNCAFPAAHSASCGLMIPKRICPIWLGPNGKGQRAKEYWGNSPCCPAVSTAHEHTQAGACASSLPAPAKPVLLPSHSSFGRNPAASNPSCPGVLPGAIWLRPMPGLRKILKAPQDWNRGPEKRTPNPHSPRTPA